VLDEPNAHLDMAGEAALTRALMTRRAAGVTVIVMAHRAGALAAINRLMVMQDGKIIQDGPRDDILTLLAAPVAGVGAGNMDPSDPTPQRRPIGQISSRLRVASGVAGGVPGDAHPQVVPMDQVSLHGPQTGSHSLKSVSSALVSPEYEVDQPEPAQSESAASPSDTPRNLFKAGARHRSLRSVPSHQEDV
jgi:ABC-type multidrug transport system ATPase subunit